MTKDRLNKTREGWSSTEVGRWTREGTRQWRYKNTALFLSYVPGTAMDIPTNFDPESNTLKVSFPPEFTAVLEQSGKPKQRKEAIYFRDAAAAMAWAEQEFKAYLAASRI